jgi:hypothetical protein
MQKYIEEHEFQDALKAEQDAVLLKSKTRETLLDDAKKMMSEEEIRKILSNPKKRRLSDASATELYTVEVMLSRESRRNAIMEYTPAIRLKTVMPTATSTMEYIVCYIGADESGNDTIVYAFIRGDDMRY